MKTSNSLRLQFVGLVILIVFVGFHLPAQTTLDAALNVPGGLLEFTSSSIQVPTYPWTVVTEPELTHDGMSAARSGACGRVRTPPSTTGAIRVSGSAQHNGHSLHAAGNSANYDGG